MDETRSRATDHTDRTGCILVSLGSMTLRTDAAGLVAVSLVNFAFEGA